MKKLYAAWIVFLCVPVVLAAQNMPPDLKVVIIRHGEKPANGDNLNCQGLNRSRLLPGVIVSKFGVPAYCYVPSLTTDSATKHARMFETVTPLAAQYNLTINSAYKGGDASALATDILKKKGTVLVVWDHKKIVPIVNALGIKDAALKWEDNDFDSIWIITISNGNPIFTKDVEGLQPSATCN